MDPEVPAVEVPVDKVMAPLTPLVPALALTMLTAPLEVAEPTPLLIRMSPPVLSMDAPALTTTSPPKPYMLEVLPASTDTWPPLPVLPASLASCTGKRTGLGGEHRFHIPPPPP